MKTKTKRKSAGEFSTADLVEKSKTILGSALGDLEVALVKLGTSLRAAKPAKHDRDGWSHHAWLTKQVAQVAGEVRKLEAGERRGGSALTIALVLSFVRQLAPADREGLMRDIEAMDDEGSVLG